MSNARELVEQLVATAAHEAGATEGLVVGEFVIIIAAANGWDAEGEQITQVVVMPDGGSESRILGLIEHARVRLQADILSE